MPEDIKKIEDDIEEQAQNEPQSELAPEKLDEAIDYKDKWLRAAADYQNLQKEVAQQRSVWAKMSKVDVLVEFIPVYENFKKAFQTPLVPDDSGTHIQCESWKKGIGFIMKQFEDILRRHNIESVKTVGEMFDPTRHEAIGEEVSEDHEENVVLREVEGGYVVDGQVLQPAKVIISKKI